MSAWPWPQFVVALLCVIGFVWSSVEAMRSQTTSSDRATLHIVLLIAYYAAYAYVLHAGRFW